MNHAATSSDACWEIGVVPVLVTGDGGEYAVARLITLVDVTDEATLDAIVIPHSVDVATVVQALINRWATHGGAPKWVFLPLLAGTASLRAWLATESITWHGDLYKPVSYDVLTEEFICFLCQFNAGDDLSIEAVNARVGERVRFLDDHSLFTPPAPSVTSARPGEIAGLA